MNSGRMKLYFSGGLALVLLVQVVLFIWFSESLQTGLSLVLSIMVVLALVAVYANYRSVKRTEEKAKSLSKDYRDFFVNAGEAIGSSSMKRGDKRDTMDLILEILLHAHEDGRGLEDVVGSDPSGYINNFIEASGGRLTPLYLIGLSTTSFFLYLLMIKAYKVFRDGNGTFDSIGIETLDVGIVATYFIIAFVFLPWLLLMLQKASKEQWSGLKRLIVVLPLSIPLALMAILIFVENKTLRQLMDRPLPIMENIWLIIISGLLALGGIVLIKYSRKVELKKILKD